MDLQGCIRVSQVALVVKNLHANAGDVRDTGFAVWGQLALSEDTVDCHSWKELLLPSD